MAIAKQDIKDIKKMTELFYLWNRNRSFLEKTKHNKLYYSDRKMYIDDIASYLAIKYGAYGVKVERVETPSNSVSLEIRLFHSLLSNKTNGYSCILFSKETNLIKVTTNIEHWNGSYTNSLEIDFNDIIKQLKIKSINEVPGNNYYDMYECDKDVFLEINNIIQNKITEVIGDVNKYSNKILPETNCLLLTCGFLSELLTLKINSMRYTSAENMLQDIIRLNETPKTSYFNSEKLYHPEENIFIFADPISFPATIYYRLQLDNIDSLEKCGESFNILNNVNNDIIDNFNLIFKTEYSDGFYYIDKIPVEELKSYKNSARINEDNLNNFLLSAFEMAEKDIIFLRDNPHFYRYVKSFSSKKSPKEFIESFYEDIKEIKNNPILYFYYFLNVDLISDIPDRFYPSLYCYTDIFYKSFKSDILMTRSNLNMLLELDLICNSFYLYKKSSDPEIKLHDEDKENNFSLSKMFNLICYNIHSVLKRFNITLSTEEKLHVAENIKDIMLKDKEYLMEKYKYRYENSPYVNLKEFIKNNDVLNKYFLDIINDTPLYFLEYLSNKFSV